MLITTMFIQLSEFNFAHGQPTCKELAKNQLAKNQLVKNQFTLFRYLPYSPLGGRREGRDSGRNKPHTLCVSVSFKAVARKKCLGMGGGGGGGHSALHVAHYAYYIEHLPVDPTCIHVQYSICYPPA